MTREKKTCFIIMPISTRPELVASYNGDTEHFVHVLEHLHIPAVEKAGFEAIPTITTGAGLITAEVIENLQTADLVLCDMSDLNPNVFFEYGIRTALNKSVCVVKDKLTDKVPFDVAALNYKEYSGDLGAWLIDEQISLISEHIKTSYMKTPDSNKLWEYFGLNINAEPISPSTDSDGKISLLMEQLSQLREDVSKFNQTKENKNKSSKRGHNPFERKVNSKLEAPQVQKLVHNWLRGYFREARTPRDYSVFAEDTRRIVLQINSPVLVPEISLVERKIQTIIREADVTVDIIYSDDLQNSL